MLRDVEIRVVNGPMAGHTERIDLGRKVLGREPGADGLLLTGDEHLSRRHAELSERDGEVWLQNLSRNGSVVNGKLVQSEARLRPGTEIRLGDRHRLEVRYRPVRQRPVTGDDVSGGLLSTGPLAKPAVRIALAAYLLGMVFLAVGFSLRDDSDVLSEFAEIHQEYETSYRPEGVSQDALQRRAEQARMLVQQMAAKERAGLDAEARRACRSLMALDSDPSSPIYRYAARSLGRLEASN